MSRLQAGFLPGSSGSLHVSFFHPEALNAPSAWVVHVPAFAEEMNKSRAMVARQARSLASQGLAVLVPDLRGTGDSAGRLKEATWQGWQDDIACVVAWAREQGAAHITLWGNRMGCLLAAQVAHGMTVPPQQLLWWQPVHSGKQHMTQFLRLRMAAGLSNGGSETVAQLKERLLQEELLEVAGYTVSSSLFSAIESLSLAELAPPVETRVRILEVVNEVGKPVLPVTAKLVEALQEKDIDCRADTTTGDPFWMTQELGFAPELIQKTTDQLLAELQAYLGSTNATVPEPNQVNGSLCLLRATSEDNAQALVFSCDNEQLVGVLHHAAGDSTLGVVIVVGGPQYRAGSHRQFVYLARYLAEHDIPVLRFDYRGMGDSSGHLRGFMHIDTDIRCAIDTLQTEQPNVSSVVIWGLCDAATAAALYAPSDSRVKGLILANPWVYSEHGAAKAYLKYYYVQRIFSQEFWRKLTTGKVDFSSSLKSIGNMLKNALAGRAPKNGAPPVGVADEHAQEPSEDLVTLVGNSLSQFTGHINVILSGNDLTSAEFSDASRSNRPLRRLMTRENVKQIQLPNVDHTFSRQKWRGNVEEISLEAVKRIR